MATIGDPGIPAKPAQAAVPSIKDFTSALSALKPAPWYQSGVSLLAGLSWVCLYATLFLLMLEVVKPDRISAGALVVFFVVAVLCSFVATGRGLKRQ